MSVSVPRAGVEMMHMTSTECVDASSEPDLDSTFGGSLRWSRGNTGYLKAVWPKMFGPVLLGFRPEIDPGTPLDRRGLPGASICTKNQPRRPILRPFRGTQKLPPDCLQVPETGFLVFFSVSLEFPGPGPKTHEDHGPNSEKPVENPGKRHISRGPSQPRRMGGRTMGPGSGEFREASFSSGEVANSRYISQTTKSQEDSFSSRDVPEVASPMNKPQEAYF